jgi:UDP-N-acetylmuramate dehydrogenase
MHEELQQLLGDRFKENEPMSKHTNFRIGGPAKYFVEVKSAEELQHVLSIADSNSFRTCILGGGSNMLVSDQGFDGVMIKIAMREMSIDKNRVHADSGVPMILLARKVGEAGLAGLEWAITLPGTVGGAVRGNAGCYGGETKDYLVEAVVLSEEKVVTRSNEELRFGYRESLIKHSSDIVLSATFELPLGDPEMIKQLMDSNLLKRKAAQPTDAGSAGCMFKNFDISSDEELEQIKTRLELTPEMIASRRISVGWLIDQLDLKGFGIGGAKVSEKHGNFLVNSGNATADEIVQLIAFIKTRARDTYGIILQEEVQYVGF